MFLPFAPRRRPRGRVLNENGRGLAVLLLLFALILWVVTEARGLG